MIAGSSWDIRPYTAADQPGIEGLLDADADHLWIAQGHRLHGEARDGERWRRTLVAERAGRVVGAVTLATNRVHPGRYNLALEVDAASRRRGLARTLIAEARLLAPEPLPLAGKLRPSDPAGVALLRSVGGSAYQRCPGLCPDPTVPEVRDWCTWNTVTPEAVVASLAELPRADWSELWVRQYLWVHQDWSPAAEGPLRELATDLVADADPVLSTITIRGARVAAITWVFDVHDGTVEIVAETTERHTPSGVTDVAAGLARSLSLLPERGVRRAEIDGHLTDPHLAPVLGTLPPGPREPLDLVELDPASTPLRPATSGTTPAHGAVARQQ